MSDNKNADKITNVSRISPKNSSETVESDAEKIGFNKKILKETYISPEQRHKIIDDLRLL